jgi:hypothetical protein
MVSEPLSRFPFVVVRLGCRNCKRFARLGAKFVPEIELPDAATYDSSASPGEPLHPARISFQQRYACSTSNERPGCAMLVAQQVTCGEGYGRGKDK